MIEKWKPEIGDAYYFFDSDFNVTIAHYNSYIWDDTRIAMGNCFKTLKEAESAAEKVKALLLSLHDNGEALQADMQDTQLPDWCKVGEYGYAYDSGYFRIVEIIDGGNNLKVEWIKEGVQGTVFGCNLKCKKQARLRQYNADEMKALVGKVIKETKTGDISFVTGFCNNTKRIYSGTNSFTAELLLSGFVFTNNSPCGVFEHLNDNGEWEQ